MGVASGSFAVPATRGNSLMGFEMAATRIRTIGRWAAFVAAYALVFNVMLISTLLASISPLKFNALHELCLNGSSTAPDADGNSDPAKPIVRCPLCLSNAVAMADQPPQTPALAIRIALRVLFEPAPNDRVSVRFAESNHQPRGPPHLS
jgi:hypothetical protein